MHPNERFRLKEGASAREADRNAKPNAGGRWCAAAREGSHQRLVIEEKSRQEKYRGVSTGDTTNYRCATTDNSRTRIVVVVVDAVFGS